MILISSFDEKYKAGLLTEMDKAYEVRRLFLKDKCKTFTLEKEVRDLDFDGLGQREVLNKIYDFLVEKYKLGGSKEQNKKLLTDAGYIFGDEILGKALHGEFIRSSALMESKSYYTTRKKVNTHVHGIELLHSVDAIKSAIGMQTSKVKIILERIFRRGGTGYKKILMLDTSEFYAFVINNEHNLKEEFREVTAKMHRQQSGNKFNAFKRYAKEKNLQWGFVRDLDNQLYINNTEFIKDMSDEHWVSLNEVF